MLLSSKSYALQGCKSTSDASMWCKHQTQRTTVRHVTPSLLPRPIHSSNPDPIKRALPVIRTGGQNMSTETAWNELDKAYNNFKKAPLSQV